MVDHNAAAAKQIDSMTDKVAESEISASGDAVQNLQGEVTEPQYLIPDREDMEILQKSLGSTRFQVIDNYTAAEGNFEQTFKGLLRTF